MRTYLQAITEAANEYFIGDRSAVQLETFANIIGFIYGRDEKLVSQAIVEMSDGFGGPQITTFQVINGFIAEGERAITCDETQLADGWYALLDGDADPTIREPAASADEARKALLAAIAELNEEAR